MQEQSEQTNNVNVWRTIVGALSVALIALVGLNFQRYGLPPFSDDEPTAQGQTGPTTSPTSSSAAEPTQPRFPDTDELSALVQQPNGSWIAGNHQDLRFTLSGEVPDENSKANLEQAMRETYGDLAVSELMVNPNAPSEEWLVVSPTLIKEFASHIIHGGFALGDDVLHLLGDVPNQTSEDAITSALSGLEQPIEIDSQVDVLDLKSPTLTARHEDGRLFMFGLLPNQEILDEITQSAIELYGADNVTINLLVDKTTFAPLTLARWQENLVAFYPFGDYEIQIKNGSFTGELQGGIVFERGSAALTDGGKAFLDVFPALIKRSNGQVTVVGHTDNSGTQDTNQTLSQQRSKAVADYLISNEIPPQRVSSVGKGDTEPTASNSTEEGRQQNRRVEIVIAP